VQFILCSFSFVRSSEEDTLERSLMMRCVFHLCAVALDHKNSPFNLLLKKPELFASGHLISMPDDLMSALAYALGNA